MNDDMVSARLDLQTRLGHIFTDPRPFEDALTHASTGKDVNYERLEFLGDRVLGLAMAHLLYTTFPDEPEGGLAQRFAALVSGETLAGIAREIGVPDCIDVSAAEKSAGGTERDHILADVMEALIGAMYLDGGFAPAEALVRKLWAGRLHTLKQPPREPKTALQEWAQARGLDLPVYDIIEKTGPDHAPEFLIEVRIDGYSPVRARAGSRRLAEKEAARLCLEQVEHDR